MSQRSITRTRGANLAIKNNEGRNPIHIACKRNSVALADALLNTERLSQEEIDEIQKVKKEAEEEQQQRATSEADPDSPGIG